MTDTYWQEVAEVARRALEQFERDVVTCTCPVPPGEKDPDCWYLQSGVVMEHRRRDYVADVLSGAFS